VPLGPDVRVRACNRNDLGKPDHLLDEEVPTAEDPEAHFEVRKTSSCL
jgi:hypothetical protein